MEDQDDVMSSSEAAKYVNRSTGSLEQFRYNGTGPKWGKWTNGRIYYRRSDLDAWLATNPRGWHKHQKAWLGVDLPPAEIKPMPPSVDEIVDKIFSMRSQEAIKHDDGKPRMDLIPPVALEEIAQVFAKGAEKYGEHNYRHGLKYSRIVGAAMRHINEFNAGIDLDADDGLPHLAHAACCLMMLQWMSKHRPDMDDRWKEEREFRDIP